MSVDSALLLCRVSEDKVSKRCESDVADSVMEQIRIGIEVDRAYRKSALAKEHVLCLFHHLVALCAAAQCLELNHQVRVVIVYPVAVVVGVAIREQLNIGTRSVLNKSSGHSPDTGLRSLSLL